MKILVVNVYNAIGGENGVACSYVGQMNFLNKGVIFYQHRSIVNNIGHDSSSENYGKPMQ